MRKILFLSLLFLVPLLVFPLGNSPYEPVKVIVSEIIIEILFVFSFEEIRKFVFARMTFLLMWVGIVFLLSLFLFLIFPSSIAFWGNIYRLQGVFLLWHLILLMFISRIVAIDFKSSPIAFWSLVYLFLLTIFDVVDHRVRASASLGEPNALAAVVLGIWPIAWANKRCRWYIFLMTVTILFFSGSRSGQIGFVLQLLFFAGWYFINWKNSRALLFPIVIYCVAIGGTVLLTPGGWESRTDIWGAAWRAGWMSPVWGNGFGMIAASLHRVSWDFHDAVYFSNVDSSHNLFLDWWVQGGIIGLVGLISLIVLSGRRLLVDEKPVELGILVGIVSALSFNPASVVSLIYLFFILGRGL